jgi:3-oxo-5-alpha-steroid 4-dehydrogenase 1
MISLSQFNTLVYAWIAIAVILFPIQLFITAPYGRHSKTSWGPMISNRLGWFFMEIPALIVFLAFAATSKAFSNNVVMVIILAWVLHYFHRAVIFPLRIRTKGKKMPVLIAVFAFTFNLMNGFINGYWFGHLSEGYDTSWFMDPRFIIGIIMFGTGYFINQYHDRILIKLRKSIKTGYAIPQTGLFKYISCPNFFGEMVEWAGFAVMTWCLPSLSFFVWTFANLVPRAIDHHKWYRKTFSDYPHNRKAIIPFIL